MSYSNLINANLALAFRLLKDLATTGTIVKKSNSGFDFGTAAVDTEVSAAAVTVSVILVDNTSTHEKHKSSRYQVLLQNREIASVSMGDSLTIPAGVFTISNVIRSNSYIIFADVAKEG